MVGFSHKISPTLKLSTLGTVFKHQDLFPLGTSISAQVVNDVTPTVPFCSVDLFLVLDLKCPNVDWGTICIESDLSQFFG